MNEKPRTSSLRLVDAQGLLLFALGSLGALSTGMWMREGALESWIPGASASVQFLVGSFGGPATLGFCIALAGIGAGRFLGARFGTLGLQLAAVTLLALLVSAALGFAGSGGRLGAVVASTLSGPVGLGAVAVIVVTVVATGLWIRQSRASERKEEKPVEAPVGTAALRSRERSGVSRQESEALLPELSAQKVLHAQAALQRGALSLGKGRVLPAAATSAEKRDEHPEPQGAPASQGLSAGPAAAAPRRGVEPARPHLDPSGAPLRPLSAGPPRATPSAVASSPASALPASSPPAKSQSPLKGAAVPIPTPQPIQAPVIPSWERAGSVPVAFQDELEPRVADDGELPEAPPTDQPGLFDRDEHALRLREHDPEPGVARTEAASRDEPEEPLVAEIDAEVELDLEVDEDEDLELAAGDAEDVDEEESEDESEEEEDDEEEEEDESDADGERGARGLRLRGPDGKSEVETLFEAVFEATEADDDDDDDADDEDEEVAALEDDEPARSASAERASTPAAPEEDDVVLSPEPRAKPARPAVRAADTGTPPPRPAPAAAVRDRAQLVRAAGSLIIERKRVAVSMLQREFDLDFQGATVLLDELQQLGLIGPYMGGTTRDILMTLDEWLEAAPSR